MIKFNCHNCNIECEVEPEYAGQEAECVSCGAIITIPSNTNQDSDTKECPFCAETIKAKAIMCRFCKKQLRETEEKVEAANKPESVSPISLEFLQGGGKNYDHISPEELQGVLEEAFTNSPTDICFMLKTDDSQYPNSILQLADFNNTDCYNIEYLYCPFVNNDTHIFEADDNLQKGEAIAACINFCKGDLDWTKYFKMSSRDKENYKKTFMPSNQKPLKTKSKAKKMTTSSKSPKRVPCSKCGTMILPVTAKNTGGLCMPCSKGNQPISAQGIMDTTRCPQCGQQFAVDRIIQAGKRVRCPHCGYQSIFDTPASATKEFKSNMGCFIMVGILFILATVFLAAIPSIGVILSVVFVIAMVILVMKIFSGIG